MVLTKNLGKKNLKKKLKYLHQMNIRQNRFFFSFFNLKDNNRKYLRFSQNI